MLSETDMRILDMLKENSRVSLKKIARELGVSETAVKKRMDRLKNTGVIRKYTIEINEKVIGHAKAFACIDTSDERRAIAFIKNLPFVSSIFITSGSHNLVVELEGPEGLIPHVFEKLKKAKFVKRACFSTVVRMV